MYNPKMVVMAYCLAVAFILAVAFHSPSKMLIATSAPVDTPMRPQK